MIKKLLAAILAMIVATPCAATVSVVTSYADFAQGNVVAGGYITDPTLAAGARSTVKNGVTFSTINTTGSVSLRFTPRDIYNPIDSYQIRLTDNQLAFFAFGSFGFDYYAFASFEALFVNGVRYTAPVPAPGGFLGFVSDDASAPTVVSVQLSSAALTTPVLDVIDAFTATPAVSVPNPTPSAAVPEPSSWAMLIAGLGVVGGLTRRRRRTLSPN